MLNEQIQSQMLVEYQGYIYDKRMDDYAYQCEIMAPHVIHGARVILDGDQWCCILGDMPTGVAGFGNTPKEACAEFDRIWMYGE